MAFGQQPDKNGSLLMAIGVKPKSPQSSAPSSMRDRLSSYGGQSQPGSDPNTSDPATQTTDPNAQQGKASRDDAGFIPAGQICGGCVQYTKETGECASVEGVMQPHDSCKTYYQAANASTDQSAVDSTTGSNPLAAAAASPKAGSPLGL